MKKWCLLAYLTLAALTPAAAGADVRVEVSGGADDLREAVTAASLLVRAEASAERSVQDLVAAARADYARLLSVLYENGHFGPIVRIRLNGQEAARLSPFSPPAEITEFAIQIEAGPTFRIGQAVIAPLAPEDAPTPGFTPGAPATTPILRQAAEAAIDGWRQAGHATAAISDQRLTARQAQALVDAEIRLAPGPLIRFGQLRPQGQTRMRAERIEEIAGLPTGAVFDPDTLARVATRLRRIGVFRSVALEERAPDPAGVMDIGANLAEGPLRRLGFGAEVGSDEGGALSAYWLHRNLRGGAERLRFDAEVSGIGGDDGGTDWSVASRFDRPATLTPDTDLVFETRFEGIDDATFDETLFEVEGGFDHIFTDQLSGRARIGFRLSEIEDALGSRQVSLATLPLGLTYDSRDDPLDARDGYFADLTLTPFVVLDGTGNGGGVLSSLDARGYLALGASGRSRLAGRLQLGSVSGADFTDLPPDYLFYSGGGDTVRGQAFQSLGAVQNGIASGGRGFAALSAEFRTDLNDTFGFVAFADAGYVSADPLIEGGTGEWHSGAGLGLRYNTTIGPIRVDLATPVSGDNAGDRLFLYIGLGQAF